MKLIDPKKLYEQIAEKEDLARQRVIDTPSRLPNGNPNPYATRYATQLDERTNFKFMIADAPTVEAEPVKHGRWIWNDAGYYECSNCEYIDSNNIIDILNDEYKYCPNCGARMDEVEE